VFQTLYFILKKIIIKKSAKKQRAGVFWLDGASIRSDEPLLGTWGLKGKTPTVRASGSATRH